MRDWNLWLDIEKSRLTFSACFHHDPHREKRKVNECRITESKCVHMCHYGFPLTTSLLPSLWLIVISVRSAARKLTEGNDASSRPLPFKAFSGVSEEEGNKLANSLEEHQQLHAMHLLVHNLPYNHKHVCIDHDNMADYDLLVEDSSI